MLATRFVGMHWLQLLPPPVVVGLGLLTYGAGLFGMTTIALAPLCGALFERSVFLPVPQRGLPRV
jgi:hypothetical protein